MIPTPKFYVLYNGEQGINDDVLKLSDAFILKDSEPMLELTAKIVDININSGEVALTRSSKLQGYSFLVEEIRKNQHSGMTRDKAIVAAIDTCIKLDVLTEFLTEHYAEVSKMLNWEYDADAERRVLTEEARQEGRQERQQEVVEELTKMIDEGIPFYEALEKIKAASKPSQPS